MDAEFAAKFTALFLLSAVLNAWAAIMIFENTWVVTNLYGRAIVRFIGSLCVLASGASLVCATRALLTFFGV